MRKITKVMQALPTMPKRKRVAAYARVSNETGRLLHSLSAQVSHYSAYIQRNPEWEYAGVYADRGETGTSKTRSDFQRLIDDCEAGKVDIVLTKTVSRFARNTVDLLETVRRLKEIGVEVRFEEQGISSMSGDGELMLTILASFAQEESRSISENIKWRFRNGFKEGKQKHTQVYGYRWDGDNYVIHPEEAVVVRYIFSGYLDGKSPRTLGLELDAMGAKPMFSGKFSLKTIFSMLENEKYVGVLVMQKTFMESNANYVKKKNNGELPRYVIEDAHPAIIDREVFDKVQARLKERKVAVERTVFTGKILCEVCGLNFQRATKQYRGRKTKVMTCINRKNGRPCGCDTKAIPEKALENVTAEVLGLSAFDADVFEAKVKQIVAPSKNTLVFHFKSGKKVTRTWISTANKDCWTPERRAAQSERNKARVITDECRKAQSEGMKAYYAANPERRKADSERMKKFCADNPEWGKEQNERMTARLAEIKANKEKGNEIYEGSGGA